MINKILDKFNLHISKLFPRPFERFAMKGDDLVGIEVGVWEGRHAKSILDSLNIKKLYLIDPYKEYNDHSEDRLKMAEREAVLNLDLYRDQIVWIKKSSLDVESLKEIDFVYLDGNHKYEHVKKELEKYFLMIKENGILAGHDIGIPDIVNAVSEFAIKEDLKVNVLGNDWWIVKSA